MPEKPDHEKRMIELLEPDELPADSDREFERGYEKRDRVDEINKKIDQLVSEKEGITAWLHDENIQEPPRQVPERKSAKKQTNTDTGRKWQLLMHKG